MCTAYRAYRSRYRETSAPYAFTSPCSTRVTSAASELSIPSGPSLKSHRHSGVYAASHTYDPARSHQSSHQKHLITLRTNLRQRMAARRIKAPTSLRLPHQHLGRLVPTGEPV